MLEQEFIDKYDLNIIITSAKQGGGKTTLNERLKAHYPKTEMIKFADPMYEVHSAMWDVMDRYNVIPREAKSSDFLQWFGTTFGRTRKEFIWIECAQNKIKQLAESGIRNIIIDDCRLVNEFKSFKGKTIRLECARDIRKLRTPSWRVDEYHQTEIDLDSFAAQGKFDLYLDSGLLSADDVFERVVDFLDHGTTQGLFAGHRWHKHYDKLDLLILPMIFSTDKIKGKEAYRLIGEKKAGAISEREAYDGVNEILIEMFGSKVEDFRAPFAEAVFNQVVK